MLSAAGARRAYYRRTLFWKPSTLSVLLAPCEDGAQLDAAIDAAIAATGKESLSVAAVRALDGDREGR